MDPTEFEKELEMARVAARRAVREVEAIVEAIGDGPALSKRQGQKRIEQLRDALVEVKKNHAVAAAHERHLTQLALAEPLDVQRAIVAEISAAVARLGATVATVTWNLQVEAAQGAAGALASARDALATMRASVAKVEALSADVFARQQAALIPHLDREMTEAKMCVAVSVATRNASGPRGAKGPTTTGRAGYLRRTQRLWRACWPPRRPRSRT